MNKTAPILHIYCDAATQSFQQLSAPRAGVGIVLTAKNDTTIVKQEYAYAIGVMNSPQYIELSELHAVTLGLLTVLSEVPYWPGPVRVITDNKWTVDRYNRVTRIESVYRPFFDLLYEIAGRIGQVTIKHIKWASDADSDLHLRADYLAKSFIYPKTAPDGPSIAGHTERFIVRVEYENGDYREETLSAATAEHALITIGRKGRLGLNRAKRISLRPLRLDATQNSLALK